MQAHSHEDLEQSRAHAEKLREEMTGRTEPAYQPDYVAGLERQVQEFDTVLA